MTYMINSKIKIAVIGGGAAGLAAAIAAANAGGDVTVLKRTKSLDVSSGSREKDVAISLMNVK